MATSARGSNRSDPSEQEEDRHRSVQAEVPGDQSTRSATETAEFWKNHGEFNDVQDGDIQTTVFRLPSTALRKRTDR